ncbi:ATP-binding cassette domain-containing protein [Kineococcus aurantiacus]|uniref:Peptide/nickel transport system ATP-binding protein n=1 Tax=Kineococcus aurantiacus TaxID=37633 RepID=A0A7Y9DQB4_9ACTN|nr:peptide/nickel transport system ATP-binding protein [Kineococcus aurantiacus]
MGGPAVPEPAVPGPAGPVEGTDPTGALVHVRGLRIAVPSRGGARHLVDGLDLDLAPGGAHGLVGASGSGKTTAALALAGHLPPGAEASATRFQVAGHDVLALRGERLRAFRAGTLGVVHQDPARALNPTAPVGPQVAEVFRLHGQDRAAARAGVLAGFERVGLPDPPALARRFPHELSGGQQQRVVIAMALAARPRLLLLDEPTTALDARVAAGVMRLLEDLRAEHGFATLLISHDLHLVAAHSRQVTVLAQGEVVETGPAGRVLAAPSHPVTRALVAALPDVRASLGAPGPTTAAPRPAAGPPASTPPETDPPATDPPAVPVLRLRSVGAAHAGRPVLHDVCLEVAAGEVVALVGESGSGKSTLGRVVAGLHPATGTVEAPRGVQVVFQNPDASLNPRRRVRQVLRRATELLGGEESPEALAARVGLPPDLLDRLPGQLSGGQKQRVAIARAFAGPVPLVVCDEPTSALDVSVQAQVLDLLAELRERTGAAYLFISHDLAVVRRLADRVAVLDAGRLVEVAATERLFSDPQHPVTRDLLGAAFALHRRAGTPGGGRG